MHCLIAWPAGHRAGPSLPPLLTRLLSTWEPQSWPWGGEAEALDTPFERALAELRGDAAPCAAARAAQAVGLSAGLAPGPWALLSPLHLQLDAQQAVALPITDLQPAESAALFEALSVLFPAAEGWRTQTLPEGGCGTWLLAHPQLESLRVASLARVVQRPLTPWLPSERWLRRLQNEAQMLLHDHPVNQAREAQGRLRVNSVWLWGSGSALSRSPGSAPAPADLHLWPEVSDWEALDRGPIAALLQAAAQGQAARLTLAGDARCLSWLAPKPGWRWPWQRRRQTDLSPLLQSLDEFL
ncbi:hypothetical protein HNQ51_001595 [Inhella inkyongensis]|uniref:Phosphoglycerate mutase n=1 Tax=Inhella inkyongensis TaxID=392593 RepID=A0A840S6R7_9BURK|nr:hypothetical protein [Inhella inkyongensis]MBB5204281.1 hypothetical protein [Inhella inkyongensis]